MKDGYAFFCYIRNVLKLDTERIREGNRGSFFVIVIIMVI